MIILFILLMLIFLVGGGVGLFYVNVNLVPGSALWVCGNTAFGVFAAVGVVIAAFMALFNKEFD